MYIIKNAFRCIGRSKGRNVLIGIIVFIIALSACIGLSIRRSAEKAKNETLGSMSVTATISFDRRSAMENMTPPEGEAGEQPEAEEPSGGFDRDKFSSFMGENSALSLEEYEKYAKASTVKDFYYTSTLSLNGNDSLNPVSNETESSDAATQTDNARPMGGKGFVKGAQSDFSLIGVSGENAMTDFLSGNSAITEGEIFAENTENMECVISEELAVYNSLSVGDEITLLNPNAETETYTLKIVGLFEDSTANENSFSMMGMTSNDPANKIYVSYEALKGIISTSANATETITDETTGREYETALTESLNATYTFATVEDYETFETEVYELGLSDSYTVSSADLNNFENSMAPLETLSTTAGYFLWVILGIGAVILIVLNIFSVRERKYEIGVLTAMGMKKQKVALQFLTEIFVVTLAAVIIGAGVGAVASVPVANKLLENQIETSTNAQANIEAGFGRGGEMTPPDGEQPTNQKGGFGGRMENLAQGTAQYVDEISSATDFTVLLQLLGIAVGLTLVAGAFSVLFIMRYEPLKILSNRD